MLACLVWFCFSRSAKLEWYRRLQPYLLHVTPRIPRSDQAKLYANQYKNVDARWTCIDRHSDRHTVLHLLYYWTTSSHFSLRLFITSISCFAPSGFVLCYRSIGLHSLQSHSQSIIYFSKDVFLRKLKNKFIETLELNCISKVRNSDRSATYRLCRTDFGQDDGLLLHRLPGMVEVLGSKSPQGQQFFCGA